MTATSTLIFAILLSANSALVHSYDATLQGNAFGVDVVKATIAKIESSGKEFFRHL